uniref:Uncharacterized protein n=1 Tax=Setaria digitata TaxID=48799 RepID=A0A915PCS9_9BILA
MKRSLERTTLQILLVLYSSIVLLTILGSTDNVTIHLPASMNPNMASAMDVKR